MDLLRKGLKLSHIRLLAALSDTGKLVAAAERIGITQPAASRLAAEAEALTEVSLYERTGRGIELTRAGVLLAYRCARILQEIGDAGRDMEAMGKGVAGHVAIGSVTGPAVEFILPAIRHIRLSFPEISIEVEVATSDVLTPMLLDGRLDFSLSRLPVGYDPKLFNEDPQVEEPISIVARSGHPLLRMKDGIPPENLLEQDWVLPPVGAILRSTVERALRQRKLPLPGRVLTTSSFLFMLATVRQTNAIAPIAASVADSFSATEEPHDASGAVAVLKSDLDLSVEPYSFLTRANQELTQTARVVYDEVRRQCG